MRTILNQCFGIKSSSLYPNDLGGNSALEALVGHMEAPAHEGRIRRLIRLYTSRETQFVKTHELNHDTDPTIYVVRDGRAAIASLWHFDERTMPVRDIIMGQHRFGRWSDHIASWDPENRPNTLYLRYEDLETDYRGVLPQIATFLDRPVLGETIPGRDNIASVDGQWVRPKQSWRDVLSDADLELFEAFEGDALRSLGYE